MKRKIRRKKGPVRSKKVIHDGITFASGLEKYMYQALKKAKIKAKYEGETYILMKGFDFECNSYERQSNGKGQFVNRGNKKIQPIKSGVYLIGNIFLFPLFLNSPFPLDCLS